MKKILITFLILFGSSSFAESEHIVYIADPVGELIAKNQFYNENRTRFWVYAALLQNHRNGNDKGELMKFESCLKTEGKIFRKIREQTKTSIHHRTGYSFNFKTTTYNCEKLI